MSSLEHQESFEWGYANMFVNMKECFCHQIVENFCLCSCSSFYCSCMFFRSICQKHKIKKYLKPKNLTYKLYN